MLSFCNPFFDEPLCSTELLFIAKNFFYCWFKPLTSSYRNFVLHIREPTLYWLAQTR